MGVDAHGACSLYLFSSLGTGQRCIVLGSCYEPEIDKAAAKEILDYLMAGGGQVVVGVKGEGGGGGAQAATAKAEAEG